MTLISQEAVLDRETEIPRSNQPVLFTNRASRAPEVSLDWQRWIELGCPDQIKVAVELVSRAPIVR